MDKFIEMIEKIFDLQKGPMKFIVVVFIASLILLFVPANILETLSLDEFKNEYKKYIGLACTISALFIIISIVNFVWTKVSDSINAKRVKKYILRNLERLTPHEKYVLREFYLQRKSTIQLPSLDETVVSLENKMIIYKASNSGQATIRGVFWPYAVNSIAWENLTMAKLGLKENPSQKDEAYVFNERPEWTRRDWI